jgi:hypothetical protein
MRSDDRDPKLICSCLPLNLYEWDRYSPANFEVQQEIFLEISSQLIATLERAAQNRSDALQLVRVMAQASRLIGEYEAVGFDLLSPLQSQLQRSLQRGVRTLRRIAIHKILAAKAYDPKHKDYLNEIDDHDADTKEDWEAAAAYIEQGRDLFWNLRGRDNAEIALERRLRHEQEAERQRRRHEQLQKAGFDDCLKPLSR